MSATKREDHGLQPLRVVEEEVPGIYEVLVGLLENIAYARNLTEVSIAAGVALDALRLLA
jgi:hypothetical protein